MADITISVPKFTSVSVAPLTVVATGKFNVAVGVTEETIVLEPEKIYANDVYSGET